MASTPPSSRSRTRPLSEAWCFEAIGTRWRIDTAVPLAPDARSRVHDCIDAFDRTWSRFRDDGCIAELATGRPVDLGAEAETVLGLYDTLWTATDGAVNPLVGGALVDLGYDAELSLVKRREPRVPPPWGAVVRDGSVLTVPEGAVLDIGAVGKGHLAQLVAESVDMSCVVDAGGDIVHRGTEPLRVALEHPADSTMAVGVVELPGGRAICGSAANRRTWGAGLHHVLDARTARPTGDVVATWAIAASGAQADALATALFFAGPESLEAAAAWRPAGCAPSADWGFQAVWLDCTGLHATDNFTGELFD